MELQGPSRYRDTFTKEILRFNRGGIVSKKSHNRIVESFGSEVLGLLTEY